MACLICVVIGHIQNKGHFLHYIPATTLYTIGISFTIYCVASDFLSKRAKREFAVCISFFLIFIGLNFYAWRYLTLPTRLDFQENYQNHPLVQYVEENSKESDGIYLISVFSEYPHLVSEISGRDNTSRFPSIWYWMHLRYYEAIENAQQRDELLQKYMSMMVDDIIKNKPQILFLEDFKPEKYDEHFDILDDIMNYGENSHLITESYSYKETIVLDRDLHMPIWLPKKTPFRIYIRN